MSAAKQVLVFRGGVRATLAASNFYMNFKVERYVGLAYFAVWIDPFKRYNAALIILFSLVCQTLHAKI